MTAEERRARVLALIESVVNAHDPEGIDRFTTVPGIAGEVRGLLDTFPDLHFDVVWSVAEGDRVVVFVEMTGTHEGPFLMVQEPTHEPLRASLMLALQVDDGGMIVDNWLGSNFIAMLAQLGWGVAPFGEIVPTPHQD
jgi:predicted ester cyclase